MDPDQITELLKALGTLIDAEELEYSEEDRTWALIFEEEPVCLLELSEGAERVVLSSEIAALPEHDRIGLYAFMLKQNDQGATTGGVRLGIGDPDEQATLSVDLVIEDFAADRFPAVLEGFRACRDAWREIIEKWPGGGEPEETEVTPPLINPRMRA